MTAEWDDIEVLKKRKQYIAQKETTKKIKTTKIKDRRKKLFATQLRQ